MRSLSGEYRRCTSCSRHHAALRQKLHLSQLFRLPEPALSTNTLERLNKEVKRRADVVGISPSEASIIRLIGAVLLDANDEWQMQQRYMGVEAMG